ncbi:hypothetical protein [Kushneria konosiri]|uniref:hypothetical protein n=1 Tax=Kushneria konosiri TaxID=698828 RepID=UPI001D131FC1|nr:hypothetical protein [Kushneria konosiri]
MQGITRHAQTLTDMTMGRQTLTIDPLLLDQRRQGLLQTYLLAQPVGLALPGHFDIAQSLFDRSLHDTGPGRVAGEKVIMVGNFSSGLPERSSGSCTRRRTVVACEQGDTTGRVTWHNILPALKDHNNDG